MRPQTVFVQVGVSVLMKQKDAGILMMRVTAEFFLFPRDFCSINSTAHVAAGPTLSLDSLPWEGGIGAKNRPVSSSSSSSSSSFTLFPSLSWVQHSKEQGGDGDLKGERTRGTAEHVGCHRSKSGDCAKKSNSFHITMSLSCVCIRHGAK